MAKTDRGSVSAGIVPCQYSLEQAGGVSRLVLACKDCNGSATIEKGRCLGGVLMALEGNSNVESVLLSRNLQVEYRGSSLEALKLATSIRMELEQLSLEEAKPRQKECSRCSRNPQVVYPSLSTELLNSLRGFMQRLGKAVKDIEEFKPQTSICMECKTTQESQMHYLLNKTDALGDELLRHALGPGGGLISQKPDASGAPGRVGAQGTAGNGGRVGTVRTLRSDGAEQENPLRARHLKLDPDRLQRAWDRLFERDKRVRPGFSSTWVTPSPPKEGTLVRQYKVGNDSVRLYSLPGEVQSLYHVTPYEYSLPEDHIMLLQAVRDRLLESRPEAMSFQRLNQARDYVERASLRMLPTLAKECGARLGKTHAQEMRSMRKYSTVLGRYTAGFGVPEVLLKDPYVQDIYADAPVGRNPVRIQLGGLNESRLFDEFTTNIWLTKREMESFLARFKYMSGRPFSESQPVLETDLPEFSTRVTMIGKPLSPDGLALALRRHSTEPWTLPRLVANGSLTPMAAGLLSFLVDGRSTMLIAGSRGAGKSSLLGALMLEFPRSQRILTIEDTLELPGPELQKLGYMVQSLFVQPGEGGGGRMSADQALRVSLRLGESALIMGEVRGQEARTLYEAMRAGTAGSSVLGTIHGNSAKSIYERVVFDMQIPAKSFSATDIVVIAGLMRPRGGQRKVRRVLDIAELDKDSDGLFNSLMEIPAGVDTLSQTDFLNKQSPHIRGIASSWGISYQEALQNILMRGELRRMTVERSLELSRPELLGAEWTARSNTAFWKGVNDHGSASKQVLRSWSDWFRESVTDE